MLVSHALMYLPADASPYPEKVSFGHGNQCGVGGPQVYSSCDAGVFVVCYGCLCAVEDGYGCVWRVWGGFEFELVLGQGWVNPCGEAVAGRFFSNKPQQHIPLQCGFELGFEAVAEMPESCPAANHPDADLCLLYGCLVVFSVFSFDDFAETGFGRGWGGDGLGWLVLVEVACYLVGS